MMGTDATHLGDPNNSVPTLIHVNASCGVATEGQFANGVGNNFSGKEPSNDSSHFQLIGSTLGAKSPEAINNLHYPNFQSLVGNQQKHPVTSSQPLVITGVDASGNFILGYTTAGSNSEIPVFYQAPTNKMSFHSLHELNSYSPVDISHHQQQLQQNNSDNILRSMGFQGNSSAFHHHHLAFPGYSGNEGPNNVLHHQPETSIILTNGDLENAASPVSQMNGTKRNNNNTSSQRKPPRKRHRINAEALNEFEEYFRKDQKPTVEVMKALSEKHGEDFSKVKVWFNNRRGKELRLKRRKEMQDSLGLDSLENLLDESITLEATEKIALDDLVDGNVSYDSEQIITCMREKILDLQQFVRLVSSLLLEKTHIKPPESLELGILGCLKNRHYNGVVGQDYLRVAHLKKLLSRMKCEIKNSKFFSDQNEKLIKVVDSMTNEEFELVFGCCGTLIQPTPSNKPNSVVILREYNQSSDIRELFGDESSLDGIKGFLWTRGGLPTSKGAFSSGGSTFSKSIKLGSVGIRIKCMVVYYNRNSLKLVIKLSCVYSNEYTEKLDECSGESEDLSMSEDE